MTTAALLQVPSLTWASASPPLPMSLPLRYVARLSLGSAAEWYGVWLSVSGQTAKTSMSSLTMSLSHVSFGHLLRLGCTLLYLVDRLIRCGMIVSFVFRSDVVTFSSVILQFADLGRHIGRTTTLLPTCLTAHFVTSIAVVVENTSGFRGEFSSRTLVVNRRVGCGSTQWPTSCRHPSASTSRRSLLALPLAVAGARQNHAGHFEVSDLTIGTFGVAKAWNVCVHCGVGGQLSSSNRSNFNWA